MISSLLLFGSALKTKKVKFICYLALIIYSIATTSWDYGILFPIINLSVLFIIPVIIQAFKNKIANHVLAIISKLIYSIVIDIICYFMYPDMRIGQSLPYYVWQGIIFNYQGIVIPTAICLGIVIGKEVITKLYESKTACTR